MPTANEQSADPVRSAVAEIVTWSQGLPKWQRAALRRIYGSCELSSSDLEELELLCRQAHGLVGEHETTISLHELGTSDVPAVMASNASTALKSIANPQNVNALADDQTLNFSTSGLTIIYGDNGAGKSGYSRILKRACRARDQEDILPNAYFHASPQRATASIRYVIGDVEQPEITWRDGGAAPDSLSEISVFDSKCASVHVTATTDLAYTPIPLQLLETLARTSVTIAGRLRNARAAVELHVPAFVKAPQYHTGTAVAHILQNLSYSTPESTLSGLATLSEHTREQMAQLKSDLAADPAKRIAKVEAARRRVLSLLASVEHAERIISSATHRQLTDLAKAAKDTAAAAKLAASRAFGGEPLPEVGSEVWRRLWEAAREFSAATYPNQPFPNVAEDAVCVLCQQQLSPPAIDRLTTFETFVQANAQKAAEESQRKVDAFRAEILATPLSKHTLAEAVTLLRDELERLGCCREVVRCLALARVRLRTFARPDIANRAVPERQSEAAAQLRELVTQADERLVQLRKSLNPKERAVQQHALYELEDRAWLAIVLPDVTNEITRLKRLHCFDEAIRDTDTSRITRKATELSRLLVTNRLRDAFATEISALGLADRRVELTQDRSGYGSTRFRVSLIRNPAAPIAQVLSEGEQRCVALAAFLSELATAHNKSGVIFDDPVSSLDHMYRDAVVRRLVYEAREGRQVIVFTHDIAFLVALDDEARRAKLIPHYQSISRSEKSSGICADGSPTKAKPLPERLAKIEQRISTAQSAYIKGNADEWADEVKLITGLLRDVWEVALERAVAPVLRRHSNKIHPSGFRKLVVLTPADHQEFDRGYAFCCTFCHTDSADVNRPAPTPQQLSDELERARAWIASVRGRQDKAV